MKLLEKVREPKRPLQDEASTRTGPGTMVLPYQLLQASEWVQP